MLTSQQRRFREFLHANEKTEAVFTLADIAAATGWSPSSVKAYRSKGHWDSFVAPAGDGAYRAQGVMALSETEFFQLLTQSARARELGSWCKSSLSRALLAKSRDNMVLALELFNRPSITNRIDAFVILFVVAWEQLLKSMVSELQGDAAVFRPHKKGRKRETISLTESIQLIWPLSQKAKRNLESIQRLRDEATHLLVPETAGILSHVFQAGVLNYSKAFATFARTGLLPRSSFGLLTMVGDIRKPNVVSLKAHYGSDIGEGVEHLLAEMESAIATEASHEFAIPLTYTLTFAEAESAGGIQLVKAAEADPTATFKVVEKPVSLDRSHPYRQKDVVPLIDAALRSALDPEAYRARLTGANKTEPLRFTSHDFQSVLRKEGWRGGNNDFHQLITNPETHRYSPEIVTEIVRRVEADGAYIIRARQWSGGRK